MISKYLISVLIIFAVLGGWLGVQALHRKFSAGATENGEENPEAAGGCGMFCFCKNRISCPKQNLKKISPFKSKQSTSQDTAS